MAREAERPSQRRRESGAKRHHHSKRKSSHKRHTSTDESRSGGSGHVLSADALAKLNDGNARRVEQGSRERGLEIRRAREEREERDRRRRRASNAKKVGREEYVEADRDRERPRRHHHKDKKRRVVSGPLLEEGHGGSRDYRWLRGGGGTYENVEKHEHYHRPQSKWNKKRLLILGGVVAILIIIIIVVAVVVSQKNAGGSGSKSSSLSGISPSSIPAGSPSWLDPFQWKDTNDFNLTFTTLAIGDLPVMGLFSTWDDSKAANDRVPPLDKPWGSYASTPARGVNVGGWLSLEPFITPSLFSYDAKLGIVDEYTLCAYLGSGCASKLEDHYASFVTEQTFADIANAGLDHVRIPFSYWAVQVYDGDPYLFRTSWRYLLRGIEWARKHGLRVSLDLHGIPGSQNGWNHSGRLGAIGWMNGTNGALNVQRSLEIHDKLSKFFAQDRYKNIVSHYGLANEPRMTFLSMADVMSWTQQAASLVRKNGLTNAMVVFGDGFCGLNKWQGQPNNNNLAVDVHQYVIFNNEQVVFSHAEKIRYACKDWALQTSQSMDTATGYGAIVVAEWSQADTDCTKWLGNVNNGNRWTGTYNVGNSTLNALTPRCPTKDASCDCGAANADPSRYSSAYKAFLLMYAEAQMFSFEKGLGWWYWTWDTESAPQWSYKQGLAAGILPQKAWDRSFQCDLSQIPSFSDLPETY